MTIQLIQKFKEGDSITNYKWAVNLLFAMVCAYRASCPLQLISKDSMSGMLGKSGFNFLSYSFSVKIE